MWQLERIDAILIEDVREGDMAALAELVEKYKRMAYRVAIKITKNHEDANDVVQDAFLKAYDSIHRFRMDSSFETWLYKIVVNLSINVVKRKKIRGECALSEGTVPQTREDVKRRVEVKNDPSIQAEKKELREWVTKAVDSLPVHHRTVVILHELEGLTHSEIASILNCSESTVRTRLHYARKRLRELLRPYMNSTMED
jgi:RNA polymerase sigma-70 factor (ECF subfamily)